MHVLNFAINRIQSSLPILIRRTNPVVSYRYIRNIPSSMMSTCSSNGVSSSEITNTLPTHGNILSILPIFDDGIRNLPSSILEASVETHHDTSLELLLKYAYKALSWTQHVGEDLFGAVLIISLLQGGVALYQYRFNPKGALMIPPGLTWGIEYPPPLPKLNTVLENAKRLERYPTFTDIVTLDDENILSESDSPPPPPAVLEVVQAIRDELTCSQRSRTESVKHGWGRLNQYLVVLLPWMIKQISFIMSRYGHLMHIGLIMRFASALERQPSLPKLRLRSKMMMIDSKETQSLLETSSTDSNENTVIEDETQYDKDDNKATMNQNKNGMLQIDTTSTNQRDDDYLKVLVIGDSLSVGLGTIDSFDVNKTTKSPFGLIENIDGSAPSPPNYTTNVHESPFRESNREDLENHLISDKNGPIFPRVLSATVARRLGKKVLWRSAGVDGGDATLIRKYCIDVLKEEAQNHHPPDIVVILCGSNDLKNLGAGFSLKSPSAFGPEVFRKNLIALIQDVLDLAPGAKVVLPALPTHKLDSNSILNVFPLSFFLDSMLGYWDWQKKKVADQCPSNVIYCGLSGEDVAKWYKDIDDYIDMLVGTQRRREKTSLISSDGVHPNRCCYALWAALVANKIADEHDPTNIRVSK